MKADETEKQSEEIMMFSNEEGEGWNNVSMSYKVRRVLSALRYRTKFLFGCVFNTAGIPGLMQECTYQAGICDASIKVSTQSLIYTIITVNGLDIYFNRFTGSIDEVGGDPIN